MLNRHESREATGGELHGLIRQLFPICRSMTGDGVRETLARLQEFIPLEIHEVPTGTKVFDWVVPAEWNIRDAYVSDGSGNRIIDFKASNLHLVNGSMPVRGRFTWDELKPKLHTIPSMPDAIPYRTCFHKEDWGFCLSQNTYDAMEQRDNETYEVVIDSTLEDGSLTYGEFTLPGETDQEILLYSHICHPSLANDNLSGISIATLMARQLLRQSRRRYTYRFVFAPATIGAITWLARNQSQLHKIRHGLVLSLLGDGGPITYKKSRISNADINVAAALFLEKSGFEYSIREFEPFGYDERQFCSPGINLPMGCLMRTPSGEFPEYHTSKDDLDFVKPESLANSFAALSGIIGLLEADEIFINLKPFGEPRLGKHGLYESMPENENRLEFQQAVQWVLNLSDGGHSLMAIAQRSNIGLPLLRQAADRLIACGLLAPHK